jgi:hypothetical protein
MLSVVYNETLARSIILALRYNPQEAGEDLFAISWTIQASRQFAVRFRPHI